jgi:hypothetical protein
MRRELSIKEIELKAHRFRAVHMIDRELLERCSFRVRDDLIEDTLHRLTLELETHIYGKSHPEKHVIRFPENWLESLKERFAPSWLREKYPVRYTQVSISLDEFYPNFKPALPEYQPIIKIFTKNQLEIPIW